MKKALCCLCMIMIAFAASKAQDTGETWIKGRVFDAYDHQPIPYAQIASFNEGVIYAANEKGDFSIILQANDSIRILSMGYTPACIKLKNITPENSQSIEIGLTKAPYLLKEVSIYKKTANEHLAQFMPDDIKLGYVSDVPVGLRCDFGGKPHILAAVFNPLDFAYYHLSSVEKDKRAMIKLDNSETIQSKIDNELIAEITGFEADELNEFIVYCNTHIKVTAQDNNESIRRKIIDSYTEYQIVSNNKRINAETEQPSNGKEIN